MKTPRLLAATPALMLLLTACATSPPAPPASAREPIVCTQDVMQCPDGRFVGRQPPACLFVCAGTAPPAAK